MSSPPGTAADSSMDAQPSRVRYWVLAILCTAAAIAYVQRYSLNMLVSPIQTSLGLDKSQIGSIMFGFFAAYGLMQVPCGYLGDRWGSRKSLTLYAVLWSLATAAMAFGSDALSLTCIWSLMGAAQAGLFPCAMIAVRDWLPSTRRALASGLLACFMNVGGAMAPPVVGLMIAAGWTWQSVFAILSLPGLAWAAGYCYWFRDRPEQHASLNAAELSIIRGPVAAQATVVETSKQASKQLPWPVLLGSMAMWLICGQQFFRAAAQVFFGTWFGTLLVESPGLSPAETSLLASVPLVMLIVGSVVGGVLSDWLLMRTGSRRIARQWLSVVNLLVCAAMFAAAGACEQTYLRVGLIAVASLAMAIGGVSAYAITMDMGGAHVATVFSIMNASGSLGSALFPKYVGWLLEATHNWNYVLFSIALIYVAAAGCWARLDPRGSIFK